MAELRKCSRCRSEIELKYFGINRKGEPYKTCDNCRNKNNKTNKPTKKYKQVEEHYKFKVQDILKIRETNKDNTSDDCCPTCYQGNYKNTRRIYPLTALSVTNGCAHDVVYWTI